jgi:hypothetical protein
MALNLKLYITLIAVISHDNDYSQIHSLSGNWNCDKFLAPSSLLILEGKISFPALIISAGI